MPTAIPTPEALGLLVRRARKDLGLTQPQLALAAGVGVRFVVDLEAGKPTVRLEQTLRVVQALGGGFVVEGLEVKPPVQTTHIPTRASAKDLPGHPTVVAVQEGASTAPIPSKVS